MAELILHITLDMSQTARWANRPVGAGRGLLAQRYGRYVAGSAGQRDRTPPDLAATLVDRYSNPGDLVCDPLAGTGTMLVESVHAGRNGLGMDIEPGWVALSRANLAHAARHGATGHARVVHGDATRLPARIPTGRRGTVDLILTSPPAGPTMPVYRSGRHRAGTPIAACASWPRPLTGRIESSVGVWRVLAGCASLLRPGGLAALAFRRDPANRTVLGSEPDFVVPVGLHAGLAVVDYLFADRRGQLLTRYPGDDLTAVPQTITGAVLMLPAVAAYDVVVFGKPERRDAS